MVISKFRRNPSYYGIFLRQYGTVYLMLLTGSQFLVQIQGVRLW